MKKEPEKPKLSAPRKALEAKQAVGESAGHAIGQALVSPSNAAARVMAAVEETRLRAQIDMPDLADVLRERAEAIKSGDLSAVEAMLINQSIALQSVFAALVERSIDCVRIEGFEVQMRMALRAQNQARATLETLASIKNPPVVIARQANIANGPQQVNIGTTHAEREIAPTELMESMSHERMDARTPKTPSGGNKAMEAVGAVNGPAKCRRKGQGKP